MAFENLRHSNTSKEEWNATRPLVDDRTIVIKKANKGSCVVVLDRMDYLLESEKQLNDTSTYKSTELKEKLLTGLVESSNKRFLGLRAKCLISQKEPQYITHKFKKSTNLGKLYLLHNPQKVI